MMLHDAGCVSVEETYAEDGPGSVGPPQFCNSESVKNPGGTCIPACPPQAGLCAFAKSNKFSFGEATYRCQIAPLWVFSQLPLLGAVKCRGGILQSMLAAKREDRRGARATRPSSPWILLASKAATITMHL